ncbi:hypothetical protein JTE90_006204 [Oedothorax gibbosus]|uniref:SH3 domain-containing protein n=1 Tax=Oedothorax gibbosus TaxID=931172 RepID=A0AAV6VVX3_9ARAC|nr:hypothetical protein JTE90_006204 [Oedothorax gibbosus]
MDISLLTVLKLFYFIYLCCLTFAASNDLGLCANPDCTEPIGLGITVQHYNSIEAGKLSFKAGQNVEIFVKDYGEKKNLIGVWLEGGKRGLVPKSMVMEKVTKVHDLVPALIKYGFEENGLNDFSSQASHASNQYVSDQIPNTASNTEAFAQNQQSFGEHLITPTEAVVPNQNQFSGDASSQVHFPSSGSSFDPQSGSHTHHQGSLHLTNPHQHSIDPSIPGDFQSLQNLNPSSSFSSDSYQHSGITGDVSTNQQFGSDVSKGGYQDHGANFGSYLHQVVPGADSSAHQHIVPDVSNAAFQNVPGMANSAYQNVPPGADKAAQQLYFSNVALATKNLAEGVLSSQNNFIPNTPIHPSINAEHVVSQFSSQSTQLPAPNHQNDPLHPGNFPNQQQFDFHSSYSSPSFEAPPASPFPPNIFNGESNSQGWKASGSVPNYQQTDSHLSNRNGLNDPVTNPTEEIGNSVRSDYYDAVYQETFDLLLKQGYGREDYEKEFLGSSSDHLNPISSSDQSQQNVNPSSESMIHSSQADPFLNTQTDAYKDSHSHLQSSFKSSTELKADKPSDSTSDSINQLTVDKTSENVNPQTPDKASDNVNLRTSDASDVPSLEENTEGDQDGNEDDDGETDVEEETEDDSEDLETVRNENMDKQSENIDTGDNLENIEKEALNHDSSVKLEISSDVPGSHENESKEDFNVQAEVDGNPAFMDIFDPQSEHSANTTTLPPTKIEDNTSMRENSTEGRNNEFEVDNRKELNTQEPDKINSKDSLETVLTENNDTKNNELNSQLAAGDLYPLDDMSNYETNVTTDVTGKEKANADDLFLETSKNVSDDGVAETNITENTKSVSDEIQKKINEEEDHSNIYQIRNLKEDQKSENIELADEMGENATYPEDYEYSIVNNSLEAIRLFITELMTWVPEPLYSTLMDLESKGLSPRVPVFTFLCALPCILLIIVVVYIKETSKERCLTVKLAHIEKNVFTLSAEKNALEEKLEKTSAEFDSTKNMLEEERETFESKKTEIFSLKQEIEKSNLQLESYLEEINTLKEREKQFMELIKDHEKVHLDLVEEKSLVEKKLVDDEDELNELSDQLKEKDIQITLLQAEVQKFKQSNEDFEEKLSQLQKNCNQLLKEAEVWNLRVNELNSKLSEETSSKEELQNNLELKDEEIKSLTNLVQTFKAFEEIESTNEDEKKSNEEKLKCLMDSSNVLIKLGKQEDENKLLSDKLVAEKDKILEMEVELLESKSEIDKLKVTYNQALQDKAEATTKLEVLTNYFKDKELLLQKQLGAQEAFRERREKDADSAERQIVLIEQENASYKYQVASMKQEMEETERNLKSQIAAQEKKAHENWIAARAAERKLEDMKQETTQLRQRLTLLEREQENWVNSPRDEVIRPIPKRISGLNDESTNGPDLNNSIDPRHMFHPPPPMMLPPDRPLPPLPPLPPFLAPLEPPPFRPPPPWHHQDPSFRMTPPDFMGPPRNRHPNAMDSDVGPLQSSPLGGSDMRDSPSHSLPDFHDIPPPPRPPFFPPPPGHHPRYPMPPQYSRREYVPDKKRTDTQSDTSSMGHASQPPSLSQDNWPHNTRV